MASGVPFLHAGSALRAAGAVRLLTLIPRSPAPFLPAPPATPDPRGSRPLPRSVRPALKGWPPAPPLTPSADQTPEYRRHTHISRSETGTAPDPADTRAPRAPHRSPPGGTPPRPSREFALHPR